MDWKALIAELEEAGLTQTEIADKAGCSQPYVSQLKTGARNSPDFEVGRALVSLRDALPKKRRAKAA